MANYAHPEFLVSTEWVAQHGKDRNVRIVEVDVDTNAYNEGHIPGAIAWAWNTQLSDNVRRDIAVRWCNVPVVPQAGRTTSTS